MFMASKGQSVHEDDNLTTICELKAQTMWDPIHLITLASMATYGDSFLLFLIKQMEKKCVV
jgi:hypothetical protein